MYNNSKDDILITISNTELSYVLHFDFKRELLPKPGDLYIFKEAKQLKYLDKNHQLGDKILVIGRTDQITLPDDVFYQDSYKCSVGNLYIRGKQKKISIWAGLELLIVEDSVHKI